MLKVLCITNGCLFENCYIVYNNKNALIIDPGSESNKIIKAIDKLKVNVVGILITHYHFDHVLCLDEIKNIYKSAKIIDYKSKNNIELSDFRFKKINNFGHTMDSCSFIFDKDKIMFSGDFIFKCSIGKYDFENEEIMYNSLKEFMKYDDDIVIYPGHGEKTSVGYEKKRNYFLRGF